MYSIKLQNFEISNDLPFVFIAGPCQLENLDHTMMICDFLQKTCNSLNIPFIFKSSFDKANRSSINGKRGIGLDESLRIFESVKKEFNCPILTDIHNEKQCEILTNSVVDVLQVPAFLCRQSDLLEAAAKTGKIINIKKGQFLAPWDMKNVVEKMQHFGNENVMLTERGSCFGYNNLIVDMKALDTMAQQTKKPIIFDATHSVQKPGGLGNASGGERYFAPILAKAALASTKIAGIFCEVHQDPDKAPSDGPNMLNFEMTKELLATLKKIDIIQKTN